MIRGFAIVSFVLAGCYDSLVSDPCAAGYQLSGGTCVATGDGPDAGPGGGGSDGSGGGSGSDGGSVCMAPLTQCPTGCVDLTSDPDNCGHCGRVCASGLCSASTCVGDIAGHVVGLGHDFTSADRAMQRLFANALAIGTGSTVRIGWWRGDASGPSNNGSYAAAHAGLNMLSKTWTDTQIEGDLSDAVLTNIDSLVIEAQTGDAAAASATGARWTGPLGRFLARGRVVIFLDGDAGVSYAIASGAGLYNVGAPADVSETLATVCNPGDAVATLVTSPYLAKSASVSFSGATGAVVMSASGDAIVFHHTY